MPKYRKRPVVIDAERIPPLPTSPVAFAGDAAQEAALALEHVAAECRRIALWAGPRASFSTDAQGPIVLIDTGDGWLMARPGDWVVRGTQGEPYRVKDAIFHGIHEAAE